MAFPRLLVAVALIAPLSLAGGAEPVTNSIGMQLVPIEPGTFTMGQDGPPLEDYLRQKRFGGIHKATDRIDFDEKPAHEVTISRPFLMAVTEVTVGQYRRFDPGFGKHDPRSRPADDDAATGMTWNEAVAFCEWLSRQEGRPYRLPTEAEWEYACRAGTTTLFHTGDTLPDGHQKWFGDDNYRAVYFPPGPMPGEYDWRDARKTAAPGVKQGEILGLDHPPEESRAGGTGSLRVAQKTPNAWGLHDMHGNVAEWCLDWHGPYEAGPQPFVRIPDASVGPVFVSQNHSPAITACPNGDLLAVWFSTIGETDLTTANAAARLRLGADEWEPASPFWDAQDVNDHAPKIWWDGDRTIHHVVEARQHGDNLIRQSTDNGATWSRAEPFRPHGEAAGNPIRTKDGVIAIPFDAAGLSISRDGGLTWSETGRERRGSDDLRPGGSGPFIAGIHAPIVELADGRLLAFGRLSPEESAQALFDLKMPLSISADLGATWQWEIGPFPVVSNTQRPALLRLAEGPILLCSFTDQARTPFKDRRGLAFQCTGGEYTGTGLYAAVSHDEGKTWPDRRLVAPDGVTTAPVNGYLALAQTRDGRIQLITSQDHYTFNLAWIKALPPAPRK